MKPMNALELICIALSFGTAPSVGRSVSKRDSSNCGGTQSRPSSPSKDNFLNYCNMYKKDLAGKRSLLFLSPTVNCETLYTYYSREQYDELWKHAGQTIPTGKALLWSGTRDQATDASNGGTRYVVIGDTLVGYIADKLNIRGDKLWQQLSEKFASSLSGIVRVFLGGYCQDIYDTNSIFARNEVPHLHASSVSELQVFIVKSNRNSGYSCDNSNLDNLKNYLQDSKKGITYSCTDDQKVVNGLVYGLVSLLGFEDEPAVAPASKAPVVVQASFVTVATVLISAFF